MKLSRYVLVPEASMLLGVSRQQVINQIKRGRLKAKKLGRQWLILRSSIHAVQ